MGEKVPNIPNRFPESGEQEGNIPDLCLLGSKECLVIRHTREDMEGLVNIPEAPQWLQLLAMFSQSFADYPDYVEDELQEAKQRDPWLKVRKVDTLTVWRILSASRKPVHHIHVGQMLFSAERFQSNQYRLVAGRRRGDYIKTLHLPSLDTAKQILRNESGTPGGGQCGEAYMTTLNFEVKTPYLFCMVQFPEQNRLYMSSQDRWLKRFFPLLEKTVKKMWESDTEPMKEEVMKFCLFPDFGSQVSHLWYTHTLQGDETLFRAPLKPI